MVPEPVVTDAAVAVSVVIPTRNRAHLLASCLETLTVQTCDSAFEIVVVDNASSDRTAEIAAEAARRDTRVRIVREASLGRAPALNAGVAAARGPLLVFTDDDMLVQPGFVQGYLEFFASRGQDDLIVAGGVIHPVPHDRAWPTWFAERAARSLVFVDWGGGRALAPTESVWGGNTAVPRRVFERLGMWDVGLGVRDGTRPAPGRPELNEDIEFQSRVRAAGGEVWFVPGAVVHHRTPVPSPRVCLEKGFASGRNDYRRAPRPGLPSDRRRGARSARSWPAWASATIRWLCWSATLRVARTRGAFGRAWDAAWATGWRMEDLLSDDVRDGVDRRVRSATRRITRLATRLAPDAP